MEGYTLFYVKEDGKALPGLEVHGFPVGQTVILPRLLARVPSWEDLGILCGHIAWYTPLSDWIRGELLAIGRVNV